MLDANFFTDFGLMDIVVLMVYMVYLIFLSRKFYNLNRLMDARIFAMLGLVHLLFAFVYYSFTITGGGDSTAYYRFVVQEATSWLDSFGQATHFIHFMTYPLVHWFGLKYLGCFVVFSAISLTAYYQLFYLGVDHLRGKKRWWLVLLFLPNLQFWTVAIGKDSLMFYGICLLVYTYYYKKPKIWFVVGLLILGMVRIHILGSILIAFAMAFVIMRKDVKIPVKAFVLGLIATAMIIALPFFVERVGLGSSGEETVAEYIERTQGYNQLGDSSVYLGDSNILVKIGSYFFRPLFFDAYSTLSLLVSFENLVWIFFCFKIVFNWKPKLGIFNIKSIYWIAFFGIFTVAVPLSIILNNLGIAVRQKTMVFPLIFLCLVMQLYYNEQTEIEQSKTLHG